MFNFMLKNKRGFTLVELLVVVALLGFGAVALMNLFQSALRTFNKSEERYIKQEMVKSIAEVFQSYAVITDATKAELYANSSVVPTVADVDTAYTYIYAEMGDLDDDGNSDGYYLYVLKPGQAKTDAVCLNPETPLYIEFNVFQSGDYDVDPNIMNQCGIKVKIAAVDSDFDFDSGNPPDDYIFYDATVSYHFPNMIRYRDQVRVNYIITADGIVYDRANVYNESGKTNTTVTAVDSGAKVLRIVSDTSVDGDEITVPPSVSSFCFIATAGFGEATGEVGILCQFRDQCLKTNPFGRMFVKAYYAVSPPIADFIAEHETLKAATRVALKPLVAVAVYALEPELLIDQLPFVIMGIGSLGGIVAVAVVRRRNSKLKIKN